MNNIIRNMYIGISTSESSHPHIHLKGNIIEECTTDESVDLSHKTERKAASPTEGALWNLGDQVWETAPTSGNPPGWVCVSRVKTEMRVAAVASATTMEVDDTTGMVGGDIAGVELDNGSWHWTTVASVTDGNTFELSSGLSGDGATVNNDVITNLWKAMANLA